MPDDTLVRPLGGDTLRVRYIIAVDVGGHRFKANEYEAAVTPEEAKALVGSGRAEIVGEPLKMSDEERAALPPLDPASADTAPVHGVQDEPAEPHTPNPEHGVL